MKILLWPLQYFPHIGGLEKLVHSLALSLLDKGHEVLVVSNGEKAGSFSKEGVLQNVPVLTFPFAAALFNYQLPLIRQVLADVSALFPAFVPDIVNIHGWIESFAFYQVRVLEKQRVPACLTVHGLLEQKCYRTANCLRLWHRVQAVNTVSHAITPSLPHPFLQTIYNGLSPSKTPLKPLPKNRLLLIGRLTEEKCFPIAFYAFKQLLPQYPTLQLTLIGDGPDYEALVKLKQSLNLPIEMPGFVPPHAVESFIDQATLVLVPSSYESFSLVALEAALRARPVIASRVMGLKEVIEDQRTGLLVEPQNPDALAAAIHTLLSHPLRMEQMGQAALERAIRLFTMENTANHYLRMYEQAADLYHHSSP